MAHKLQPFRVLIAGAGIAGLEGALALREFDSERLDITLIASGDEFDYRPLRVREPFGLAAAPRYSLAELAHAGNFKLLSDSFKWLDVDTRVLHTASGLALGYDATLLALGAHQYDSERYAVTLDPVRLDAQLGGVVRDVEDGRVRSVAFLIPSPTAWPLPVYELALMLAARADQMCSEATVTIITPERSPLEVFGDEATTAVARLLKDSRVEVKTWSTAHVHAPGRLTINANSKEYEFDRILALPDLYGPAAPGIPTHVARGFVSVNPHCQVRGADRVFAAGDMTDFPVKQGAIAAEQAAAAAREIARIAGVTDTAAPFAPTVHAVLLGPKRPLYMSARLIGSHGNTLRISDEPPSEPTYKVHAPLLSRLLTEIGSPPVVSLS